jgi:SAM-dependent methyltransferase
MATEFRDEDRPPVQAHVRFAAARADYAGLGLAERFARIHETNLWGAESSTSGLGSEIDATAALRRELPGLLADLGAASLLDAPCGDGGWISRTALGASYVGVDIVPALIDRLSAGGGGRVYVRADITRDALPEADAVLCRDCLVHLSFANIRRAIAAFRKTGARWLITTTFPELNTNQDCEDGDWRPLNLQRPPFDWPAPLRLLNEGCEEAGGGWRDKSLGAWSFAAIP